MTKIRTAEDILISYAFDDDPSNAALKERTILCMQEYAKQFIDLSAEDIKNDINETLKQVNWAPDCEYKEGVKNATNFALQIVYESILKLKERVK